VTLPAAGKSTADIRPQLRPSRYNRFGAVLKAEPHHQPEATGPAEVMIDLFVIVSSSAGKSGIESEFFFSSFDGSDVKRFGSGGSPSKATGTARQNGAGISRRRLKHHQMRKRQIFSENQKWALLRTRKG